MGLNIFKVSLNLIHIITWIFALPVFIKLVVEIITEFRKSIFPAYLNFFIAFSGLVFLVFYAKGTDFSLLTKSSFLLFIWLLIDYLISRKTNSNVETADYKIISRQNLLFFSFTLGLIVLYILFIQIFKKEFSLNTIMLILLSINPAVNKIIFYLLKNKQNLPANAFVLPKVRTFIISSDKIISKNKLKLINFRNFSQSSKDTIIQTAYFIANIWNKPLAKALNNEIKTALVEKAFHVLDKSYQGIRVKDVTGSEFTFGNYSFVKDFVNNDDATHFLLKDNVLIAKFTFRELFNPEGILLANKFNEYANVVLLSSKPNVPEYSKLPFDKIYFNLNIDEQKELIKNLTQKANTALITADKNLAEIASYDYIITDKGDLHRVFEEFSYVKRIFSRITNALALFFAIETFFALIALFIFNQIINVLIVNSLISILFVIFISFFLKKVRTKHIDH